MPKRTTITHEPRDLYRRLSRWFAQNARPLPWRGKTDPYEIWISEIMLVQTTGVVAAKRYPRFLKRFPTLQSLARARIDSVMKEWEGLGYYHRARFLHQAARTLMSQHKGVFPSTYDDIRALPGVGDYVAAAIANFSFGARVPAIDANVARVAARIFGITGDVRSSAVRRATYKALEQAMTVGKGSIWTDSLIELGALICSPRNPKCGLCPMQEICRAGTSGKTAEYGLPKPPDQRKTVAVACGIVRRRDGRILIAQRPETGLLPNLWEFPGGKRDGNERLAETCRREIREELGITVNVGERRLIVRHAYSHYTVRLHVFECRYRSGTPKTIGCQRWRWVKPSELQRYAFPKANHAIIEMIQEDCR
ncbi:MAG: NUDIX domain-containing protein [candidate division Zixibacteria bacterium]|nr:NUDIX domain-containing protein [candidate division Zixibacteria bacterium]